MVNRSSTGKQVTNPGKKKVRDVMEEYKLGKLKSSSGNKVTSNKQAIAIALSEARRRKPKRRIA
jgi:hypothetical protein|tara:strand:+ start:523 stop:714 length:192 start_codon:yes stop_codon:yes gene_type:complete